MSFTTPIWLWGLTALSVPIVIHLLNRRQSKIVFFGSLRHLQASNTRESLHLRIHELALLALRCGIILWVVLLLSGWHINGWSNLQRWLVMEHGLRSDPALEPLIDSLRNDEFTIRYLAPGFPEEDPGPATLDYWQLAEDLALAPADQIIVLSYGLAEGFTGLRVGKSDRVIWITKEPPAVRFVVQGTATTTDTATLRVGNTSSQLTTFENERVAAKNGDPYGFDGNQVRIHPPDTVIVAIVSDKEFEFDRLLITAAVGAINDHLARSVKLIQLAPTEWTPALKAQWVIWLSHEPFPGIEHSNSLVFMSVPSAPTALQQLPTGTNFQHWILTKRLDETVALDEQLTLSLARLLDDDPESQKIAVHSDRRTLPEAMHWSKTVPSTEGYPSATKNSSATWILVLLTVTLISERLLAFKRSQ